MSTIRKQSIISSVLVYFGFALGFFNTYLFTKEGGFTPEQYGLIGAFIAIGNIIFSVASFGMPAFISKFFPYYKHWLPVNRNEQITFALLVSIAGTAIVTLLGILFKPILIDKIFANSPGLVHYYYWIFPFGFGMTIFFVMEAYAWQQRRAVLSNFLKEVLFRIFITTLILLTISGFIKDFDTFIKIFSFTYLFLAIITIIYFVLNKKLYFTLVISNVTKKFFKKITTLVGFIWAGGLVFNIANVFDTIVLAAILPNGLAIAGIYTLAQNIASLIQAPQRGVISASIGPLSQAWKEKNVKKINQIYHRSSINLLIFSCAMFSLIWLNFEDGVYTFGLKPVYLEAKYVFLLIGFTRIIDLGTGVNAQIIATSTFWKFEFLTGVILLTITLPLNYFLTQRLGLFGPAVSNLISFTIYNAIRYYFLFRKFRMQPFSIKSLYTLIVGVACYLICYFLFKDYSGIVAIIIRSLAFLILFITAMQVLKLSEDVQPVLQTIKKRLGLRRK